jgi:hypothetical protein
MKKLILCSFVSIVFMNVAFAVKAISLPDKCPSLNFIQKNGFDSIRKNDEYYSVCKTSLYDTTTEWTFIVDHIVASTDQMALNVAKKALINLSGNPVPQYINGHFGCQYNIGSAYNVKPIVCK